MQLHGRRRRGATKYAKVACMSGPPDNGVQALYKHVAFRRGNFVNHLHVLAAKTLTLGSAVANLTNASSAKATKTSTLVLKSQDAADSR